MQCGAWMDFISVKFNWPPFLFVATPILLMIDRNPIWGVNLFRLLKGGHDRKRLTTTGLES